MKFPDLTDASCAEVGTHFFYLDSSHADWASARSTLRIICGGCPVRQSCLDWGIKHEEFGWWGGHSPRERDSLRKEMGIRLKNINPSEWFRSGP